MPDCPQIAVWQCWRSNDVRVFNRHGIEKDERSIAIERSEIELAQEDRKLKKKSLIEILSQEPDLLKNQSINKNYKELKVG